MTSSGSHDPPTHTSDDDWSTEQLIIEGGVATGSCDDPIVLTMITMVTVTIVLKGYL